MIATTARMTVPNILGIFTSLAKKLFLEILQVHSGIWNSVLAKNIILVTMH